MNAKTAPEKMPAVVASGDLVGEARHAKGAPADLNVVIDKVTP